MWFLQLSKPDTITICIVLSPTGQAELPTLQFPVIPHLPRFHTLITQKNVLLPDRLQVKQSQLLPGKSAVYWT
jgi:hypothetical protein